MRLTIDGITKTLLFLSGALAAFAGYFSISAGYDGSGGVQHIKVYLFSCAWPDLIALGIIALCLNLVFQLPAAFRSRKLIWVALVVAGPAGWYAVERYGFWTTRSYSSYYLAYEPTIGRLIQDFRVSDALTLSKLIAKNMGSRVGESVLNDKLVELDSRSTRAAVLRNSAVRSQRQSWNPIAEPTRYFALMEALRLNPQEYGAGRLLKSFVIGLTDSLIPMDRKTVCLEKEPSQARTLNILDAQALIASPLSVQECEAAVSFRWRTDVAVCLVAISARLEAGKEIYRSGRLAESLKDKCTNVPFDSPIEVLEYQNY